jgi:hypothetical protein
MGVRKLWTEIKGYIYSIAIADGVIDGVTEGIYSAQLLYVGSGEHLGLSIFDVSPAGLYVITNQIGDKIEFDSNIPQLSLSNGTYVVDRSKAPLGNSTVYINESNSTLFCGITGSLLVHYGKYLLAQNGALEFQYNNRQGTLLSYKRYIESDTFDTVDISNSANENTNLLVLDSESFTTIRNTARDGFIANGYYYKFNPKGDWSGYSSNTLTGLYQGFGSNTGSIKVGYFNYKDSSDNEYTKSFEITESDNKWSVVYYTSNSEPSDSTAIFTNTNADPQSITFTFDDYITRVSIVDVVNTGTDVI